MTAKGKSRKASKNTLAILGFLFVLFPLVFWVSVLLKFGLGVDLIFNIWNLFYEDYMEFFLLLLPIPAFFFGLAAWRRGKRRHTGRTAINAVTVLGSIASIIFWILAEQRPG
ncbi:MAG TPA: hypothetical protein VF398_09310 [bacterium]|jgi:hypothetical protein